MNCDQCQMMFIQAGGVSGNCHEAGCPNDGKVWEDGEWVRYYECWECGSDIRVGESCDCMEEREVWEEAA